MKDNLSDKINDYGILLNKDTKLHRMWFKQMTDLIGINCQYLAPLPKNNFDSYGELDSRYYPPKKVGVIFNEHPDQKTLKKLGWAAELQEGASIIQVPYDLEHLEVGALFVVPSGIDNAAGRTFRVISMQNSMVYPASISCEIAPEYKTTTQINEVEDFSNENFTILRDCEDDD